MQPARTGKTWTPISQLQSRLEVNLRALAPRFPELAGEIATLCPAKDYVVSVEGDSIQLGIVQAGAVVPLEGTVSPAAARQIVMQLSNQPSVAGPVVVAGLDQGWLWDAISKLSMTSPAAPGHFPPLSLLSASVERLWLVMHLHDWQTLLADPRCILFAGPDASNQLQQFLKDHPEVPLPQVAVTVDPKIWPAGVTLDSINAAVIANVASEIETLTRRLNTLYLGRDESHFAVKLRTQPLRILGITSLYTTFLQHSMRDWLSAMSSLGHETTLLIEQDHHERPHPLTYLRKIADFQPDLILLIDHYRAELPYMPKSVPCVMWVQDRLPNIFRPAAGEAQGALDYVIGYGRRDCVTDFGYPRARFMECPVGVNENRFGDIENLSPHRSPAGFESQISFVSHASASPEQLISEMKAKQPAHAAKLFDELYDRLSAVYSRGEFLTQECFLHRIVEQALAVSKVSLSSVQPLVDFVTQKLNNAFFRHQVLHWLVDAGYEPALYGKGWENHPRFAPFARGPADNQNQLASIYRGTQINLQATPFGAAHQRLYEGLCAGGFFLMRKVTGDDVEPMYSELWAFCRATGIRDVHELKQRADDRVLALLQIIEGMTGEHPFNQTHDLVDGLRALAQSGFTRAASTLWPADYDRVAFATREQLLSKVKHYLQNADERRVIVHSMRARVLQTVTYRGISQRMIGFLADDLAGRNAVVEAAA